MPPSTDGVADSRLDRCLVDLAALHHHLCPRQVLGARIGLRAGELLGLDLPRADKRIFAFVETDGCFADSVSVATGCWLGHRTLRLVDQGQTAATFVDTLTGHAVRVWSHPRARDRAVALLPDAESRWHAQRDAYRSMPTDELLVARAVTLEIDLGALISRNGRRVVCDRCGEDIINDRQVIRDARALCRQCAGAGYYRIEEEIPTPVGLAGRSRSQAVSRQDAATHPISDGRIARHR